MKYLQHFVAVFAMSIILIACNNQHPQQMRVQNNELESVTADTTALEGFNTPQTATDKNDQTKTEDKKQSNQSTIKNTSANNPDWDKKIIKTADIELQLDNYKKFNISIHSSLKNFGAYIADEKQTENDYRIENSITIKVPVDQFDNLVNSFTGDGIKVTEKNISSDDVTGEVVDTKARMQAKLAVRDKYLQLLKQTKNMNEILQVQNEINDIQEDIEAANGRVNYLQHASAYSTVNLNYFQYINGGSANDEKPDFFTKLSRAFSTGTFVITNLILFCISIWPIILIILFTIVYLKRSKLKKSAKA
jgi:uncharacterized protein DUF4349